MAEDKRIIVGADHAALPELEKLVKHLQDRGFEVTNITHVVDGRADYPAAGHKVGAAVSKAEFTRGLLMCGTGLGVMYTANRYKGVRAALCLNVEYARLARDHNDSNVLVMPGRSDTYDPREVILDTWLDTPFSGGERHLKRIHMIDDASLV